MSSDPLVATVEACLARHDRVVLAVSGGRDSMTLLHLVAAGHTPHDVVMVATFDHGTGPSATDAARLVKRTAADLGFDITVGRAWPPLTTATEAVWRHHRQTFLDSVARAHRAIVCTAHTLDDHAETICLRILRGSGARGLAGLHTRSRRCRPLLGILREDLSNWATAHGVQWVEDPSNESRQHARNRVRHDLLPALERAEPGFSAWLLDIGARAATLREQVECIVDQLDIQHNADGLEIARSSLTQYDREGTAMLWQAIAARAGVVLDRRGTRRLTEFTMMTAGASGARIQLSGGHDVLRLRDRFVLRRDGTNAARHDV